MAATGSEIASAYIALTVKAPDIKKQIEEQLGKTPSEQYGKSIGEKLSSGMKTAVKIGAAGIATILGTALVKGFGRLKEIENAQAKMRGLGFTGEQVSKAMDAALGSVKGTAFGLGEAATVASQMMAAGIKPGDELQRVLTTVANNAAAAGVGMDEMGSIFSKAATQVNGVQNDVISQLADRGLPIYQKLADQMGVTAGEVFKLASSGKIDFATFAAAAEAAAGTVAEEMGNTTTGSFDNMMAALGRLGAKILEDIFPLIGPLFQDVTKWLDEATAHVEPLVEAFGTWLRDALENVKEIWQWVKDNSDWIAPIAVAVGSAATAFVLWQGAIKAWTIATNIAKAAQLAFNIVMNANPIMLIVTAIAALVGGLIYFFTQTETGKAIWEEFTRFLGEAWENVSSFFVTVWEDYLKPVFEGIAEVATWVFENILLPAFQIVQVAFAILGGIFQGIWDFILKPVFDAIGAIFIWLFNTIIMPIIDGIVLYVQIWAAIFTWIWENIISPVIGFIGDVFVWLWENVISPVIDWISEKIELFGLGVQLLYTAYVKPIFDKISEIFTWIWNTIISPVITWIQDKLNILGLGFQIMWGVIRDVWDNISSKIQAGWDFIKGIIDTLVKVIQDDPKKAFEAARDAIGDAWSAIQDLAKKPVKFVVETVINGLIDTINKIPGVNLAKVALPKGFSDGGYTGNVPTSAIAGFVHGDEHVIRASSRRAIEASHPGLLDHMNRYGNIPGYRKGGLVHPMPGAVVTEEHETMGGYRGHKGIDLAKPAGTPILAAASGMVNYQGWYGGGGWMAGIDHGAGLVTHYKHMIGKPIYPIGAAVKQKQVIGYEGSTGDSTGPHLHFETILNGARLNPRNFMSFDGSDGGDAGIFSIFGGLKDLLMGQFEKAFPGSGMWIEAAGGVAKQGIDAAIEWGMSQLPWHSGHEPNLYDSGGWLDPGVHLVENRSGRPEPVLTHEQWETMRRAAESGFAPGTRVYLVLDDGRELSGYIDERAEGVVAESFGSGSSTSLTSRFGGRRR